MGNRDLSQPTTRGLVTFGGRTLIDFTGRTGGAIGSQAFPWSFPLWFSNAGIRGLLAVTKRGLSGFTGRGLGNITSRSLSGFGGRALNQHGTRDLSNPEI